jgi:peptidoglycan/xylan/chitin deacetylase (PgdA/CDA1 family)
VISNLRSVLSGPWVLSAGHWLPVVRRLPGSERRIALSFDDGPTPQTTPRLLELLARYNARATFFLSGERAVMHPELVRALVESGHETYGHGWEHIRFDHVGHDRVVAELERTEAFLRRFRPTPSPYLVRPPYAAGRLTAWVHRAIRDWNPDTQFAHWSHTVHDWDLAIGCRNRAELEQRCRATIGRLLAMRQLPGAVALLHDSPYDRPDPLTPQVAPTLVEQLLAAFSARGFSFVPMAPAPRQSFISRFVLAWRAPETAGADEQA